MNIYLIVTIVFALLTLSLFVLMIKHASKGERSAKWMLFMLGSLCITVLVLGLYRQDRLYYNPEEIAENVLSNQVSDVVTAYNLQDDYYEADIPKFKKGEYRENTPLKFSNYTVTNIVKKPKGQYITIEKRNESVVIYDPVGKKNIGLEQTYTFLGSPSISYPFVMKVHFKEEDNTSWTFF